MRPVKIEPNFKPVKSKPKTLCQVFKDENWPTPQTEGGEPWPPPEQTVKHRGGSNCPCHTCRPKPRPLPSPVSLPPGIPMPDQTSATWPAVYAFACAMEHKLSLNRRKGDAAGWRRDGTGALQDRLDGEVEELNEALQKHYDQRTRSGRLHVLLEAADVANFAMMIADCVENEK